MLNKKQERKKVKNKIWEIKNIRRKEKESRNIRVKVFSNMYLSNVKKYKHKKIILDKC